MINQKFHTHSKDQKRDYIDDILSANSVLCPRGWSPATYRMFEAMALGRCPVIISDGWVEIEGVDWPSCSVRVAERDVSNIRNILNERADELPKLSDNAYEIYYTFFSDERRFSFYLDQFLNLYRERTDGFYDYRRGWKSLGYRKPRSYRIAKNLRRKVASIITKNKATDGVQK